MDNVTVDSTGFSEQLGLYDFFNVILSGAIFISGLCMINRNIKICIWSNLSLQKGISLILLIYILGMILQEAGSLADRKIFNIYKGMHRHILMWTIDGKDKDENYKKETQNKIFKNPFVLERYRRFADDLLTEFAYKEEKLLENGISKNFV